MTKIYPPSKFEDCVHQIPLHCGYHLINSCINPISCLLHHCHFIKHYVFKATLKKRNEFQTPTGGVCGIVQDQHNMFVVQWGSTATGAEAGQHTKPTLPALPARLLQRFDPETAKKLADIKQMEAALRRKEIADAEAKRLADNMRE